MEVKAIDLHYLHLLMSPSMGLFPLDLNVVNSASGDFVFLLVVLTM